MTVEVIGQGTVTGAGINCGLGSLSCYSAYGSSAAVPLTETPASGWTFSGWEDDASAGSVTPTTSGATATAVFSPTGGGAVQTSTLSVSPAGGGVQNGSTNYPIDCDPAPPAPATATTKCSLTAFTGSTLSMTETPDAGNLFNGWGGACSGTGVSCAVYLQSDESVGASFVAVASKTLTVTVTGNGSVTGGGINCGTGATCSAPEPANASVTLTATPLSGYVLTGWSGGCTGTQPTCTVQISNATSVGATFAPVVTLSVTVSGNGYVTGGGIGCDGGQTCTASETPSTTITLTASPANAGGSVFWSGCTSTAGVFCTVTIGTTVQSVTATFSGGTAPPPSTVSANVTVKGDGYVVSSGASGAIHCTAAGGTGCSTSATQNTTITLTAISASGNSADFTRWLGDCAAFTSTTCTLTMNGSKTVEADFAGGNTTYTLSGQVTGSGSISGGGLTCTTAGGSGCSAPQAAGASITLAATPSFGATFGGWGGSCSGTSTTCTVSMTNAKSVTATFTTSSGGGTTNSIALSVTGAGTVTGPTGPCESTDGKSKVCTEQVTKGQTATLAAKAAKGFALAGWTGACSGKTATCKLTPTASVLVGATFTKLVLASTHTPTIVKTKAGYRLTLWFRTGLSGSLTAVAKRSGKTVVKRTVAVKAGGRHVLLTVPKRGRYVVTITIEKHSLRWGLTVK
ncbi:MAG TPA: hypothetical protein VGH92_03940 [Gaiellaceae bacterium]